MKLDELRVLMDERYRMPEADCIASLTQSAQLADEARQRVRVATETLVETIRTRRARAGGVDALMREFSLSSNEGIALMCLAEALLRIPDAATRDALIRDKIGGADWAVHLGRSPSLFVNAAAWGLVVTGKLVATHREYHLSTALLSLLAKGGEPLIRKGVDLAIRMLGRQFVTGETIEKALANSVPCVEQGYRYSYDMLGEAALTAADAQRYYRAYEDAIVAIGNSASTEASLRDNPGISIKLSALHPRYTRLQKQRVMTELLPRVRALALLARRYHIGLNIDAEESERLAISLDLFQALAEDNELCDWNGLGFVVQAYQKRAPLVLDWLISLARLRPQRKFMVRLVKGAYWDAEIKRAQIEGQSDYPVYTRKAHTDLAYQACAQKLLAATDAIYPQFATHNAYSLAWVREAALASGVRDDAFEFQCLHGMGETLYDQLIGQQRGTGKLVCRIYAPVGSHETLLAYLVRRLLENGANTSFVNRIVDPEVKLSELSSDPLEYAQASGGAPHPAIPLPRWLLAHAPGAHGQRLNSAGFDIANDQTRDTLAITLAQYSSQPWLAAPLLACEHAETGEGVAVHNPALRSEVVGLVQQTPVSAIAPAVTAACAAGAQWMQQSSHARATILNQCAEQLETHRTELIALALREAGKTLANAVSEIREAVDFCRYYAQQIQQTPAVTLVDSAPLVCISPWNFPLAIFTGQIMAALAAGHAVLAKPAEQTVLMAHRAVQLFHAAGVPPAALQLLPGTGESVGAALVANAEIGGVIFTGSTQVARLIASTLAKRAAALPEAILIAETGGQNAMIVDSSALTEQVVQDVTASAFDSAGQRCSALRVLCLQEEIYDTTLAMLFGALDEMHSGNPATLAGEDFEASLTVDIGPVIDEEAHQRIHAHIANMRQRGFRVTQGPLSSGCAAGCFVPPTVIEINDLTDLDGEVFGPVLHVLRYARENLDKLIDSINATGYGLTMGIHSRIDEHIERIIARAHIGNIYVNRNIVGAVVGVQPFGGQGLSGTGPKAGGPLYLARLGGALGFELAPHHQPVQSLPPLLAELHAALPKLVEVDTARALIALSQRCAKANLSGRAVELDGPTGEINTLKFIPHQRILCVAATLPDLLAQITAVAAVGGEACIEAESSARLDATQQKILGSIACLHCTIDTAFDSILISAIDAAQVRAWRIRLAQRPGAILPLIEWRLGTNVEANLWRLFHETSVSTNTAAAGGNASLMTLADV